MSNTTTFKVGDRVKVLRASRLPKVEEVLGIGTIDRITVVNGESLYWVSGFPIARDAKVLRHA